MIKDFGSMWQSRIEYLNVTAANTGDEFIKPVPDMGQLHKWSFDIHVLDVIQVRLNLHTISFS